MKLIRRGLTSALGVLHHPHMPSGVCSEFRGLAHDAKLLPPLSPSPFFPHPITLLSSQVYEARLVGTPRVGGNLQLSRKVERVSGRWVREFLVATHPLSNITTHKINFYRSAPMDLASVVQYTLHHIHPVSLQYRWPSHFSMSHWSNEK